MILKDIIDEKFRIPGVSLKLMEKIGNTNGNYSIVRPVQSTGYEEAIKVGNDTEVDVEVPIWGNTELEALKWAEEQMKSDPEVEKKMFSDMMHYNQAACHIDNEGKVTHINAHPQMSYEQLVTERKELEAKVLGWYQQTKDEEYAKYMGIQVKRMGDKTD